MHWQRFPVDEIDSTIVWVCGLIGWDPHVWKGDRIYIYGLCGYISTWCRLVKGTLLPFNVRHCKIWLIRTTSELPVKIFTESGKFTNVHAKNIHWCMQGPYIGLYMPIRVKTSVSSQS